MDSGRWLWRVSAANRCDGTEQVVKIEPLYTNPFPLNHLTDEPYNKKDT